MSVKTFFQSAEAIAKRTFGGVVSAETWAAPMAEKVFPGYAGLIAFATDELASLKAVTSSAGTGAMTEEQVVAALLGTIEPAVQQWAGSIGIPAPTVAEITAWLNALIAGLNAFRAPVVVASGTAAGITKAKPTVTSTTVKPGAIEKSPDSPGESGEAPGPASV